MDIQLKDATTSLAFLGQMKHLEELQLWHEELATVSAENVKFIENIPKLQSLMTFRTRNTNFEKLVEKQPFYISFSEVIDFVR